MLFVFSCSVVSNSLQPHGCSTPGFSVLHCLPEFAQTHVHWVDDAIQPSSVTSFSCLQSSPASGSRNMLKIVKTLTIPFRYKLKKYKKLQHNLKGLTSSSASFFHKDFSQHISFPSYPVLMSASWMAWTDRDKWTIDIHCLFEF